MRPTWTDLSSATRLAPLPDYYGQRYASWPLPDRQALAAPYISPGHLDQMAAWCGFPEDLDQALRRACRRLDTHPGLKLAALFLHWALFVERPFYLTAWFEALATGLWGEEAAMLGLCVLCRQVPHTLEDLARRDHPKPEDVSTNFRQLHQYAQPHHARTGHWGLMNAAWCALCVTPYLNTAHHLRFNPTKLEYDYHFYRHLPTGRLLGLAGGGIPLRADGLLCDEGERPAFTSTWQLQVRRVIAHQIMPSGFISPTPSCHDLGDTEQILGPGDILLGFHIPSGPGYTVDNCRLSFEAALALFARAYPEVRPRGFISHSWLYSPQLPLMLREQDSRIIQVQRSLFLMPGFVDSGAFATFLFNLDSLPPPARLPRDSRLRALVRDWLLAGRHLSAGCALLPLDDLGRYGHQAYAGAEDWAGFARLAGMPEAPGASSPAQ